MQPAQRSGWQEAGREEAGSGAQGLGVDGSEEEQSWQQTSKVLCTEDVEAEPGLAWPTQDCRDWSGVEQWRL